jgi:hypothetical protein
MKKLLYTFSILFFACSAFAQDLTDALRYSNYRISGTARSAAMGNAFGALGGDFTSLSINPAGVGVYRTGEFTFTPSIGKISIDGTYQGNTANDSKYNIGIDNLGYVVTIPTSQNSETGLVSVSFGLGFNRLGSFSMNGLAEVDKSNNSLLAYFTDNINNGINDSYYEDLALRTNLLFSINNGPYENDITNGGYNQMVRKTIDRKGYINEYLLSFGANFNHKFYLGGTFGIHDVYYKENVNFYENDAQNNIAYFNYFNFNTFLKTTGNGFNMKIGAIYKPIESLRLGIAFHSPTFYKLTDNFDSNMESSTTIEGTTDVLTALPDKAGVYDYELETPMKTVLSGAYVIGKSGLISVDYEIVDFSTSKLKNGGGNSGYPEENQVIKNTYKTVGNLHIGGEYRVNKFFSLRAGYENFPSVFKSGFDNSKSTHSTISGGFGFKQGNVFFDAALKRSMVENVYEKFYPDPNEYNMAKYSTNQNNFIFTLGYKF